MAKPKYTEPKKRRIGNDLSFAWSITYKDSGDPFDLEGLTLKLTLCHGDYEKRIPVTDFDVEENVISWKWAAADQPVCGNWYALLESVDDVGEAHTVDMCMIICLVPHTYMETDATDTSVDVETVELSSELQEIMRGYSAYEIAVQQGYEGTEEEWIESLHAKCLWERGGGNNSLVAKNSNAEALGAFALARGYIPLLPVTQQPYGTIEASGVASRAEGYVNNGASIKAEGDGSSAGGWTGTGFIQASGAGSFAHGMTASGSIISSGHGSVAMGINVTAQNGGEAAFGKFNESHADDDNDLHTQFSVGIGTTPKDTKNALEVMSDGRAYLYGAGNYDGTNPGEAKDLASLLASHEASVEDLTGETGHAIAKITVGETETTLYNNMVALSDSQIDAAWASES